MIIKSNVVKSGQGAQRQRLAAHLVKTEGGLEEQQEVADMRVHGLSGLGDTPYEKAYHALAELEALGMGCRSSQTNIHHSLSPDRPMSPEQWEWAWAEFEKFHGIASRRPAKSSRCSGTISKTRHWRGWLSGRQEPRTEIFHSPESRHSISRE